MSGKGLCDRCHKARPTCEWVERADSGNRYFLCDVCRDYWRGLRLLKDLDVVPEDAGVLVKKD